jgi:hypothetical protein
MTGWAPEALCRGTFLISYQRYSPAASNFPLMKRMLSKGLSD